MVTCESVNEITAYSSEIHGAGLTLGLVPTMGALHEGHLSLVRKSVSEMDRTVVSIFVNPTQFAPGEDIEKYPRDIEEDTRKLQDEGVDCVFLPTAEMMYPPHYATYVVQEKLAGILEGASRPIHFRGVLTVVLKLFNIMQPDKAYFGQKDYQQFIVVKQMVEDLNVPVEIVVLPVVREEDGLAMSSRNRYLSSSERKDAVYLYHALLKGKEMIESGEKSSETVAAAMRNIVEYVSSARVDYLSVVNSGSLDDVKEIRRDVVLAGAIYIGPTRLIDNVCARPGN